MALWAKRRDSGWALGVFEPPALSRAVMSDDFDPYQKWLGIPPQEQPPNYYRLLTLKPLEPDPGVIERTADKLTAYLEARSQGKNAAHAQQLLEEVAAA